METATSVLQGTWLGARGFSQPVREYVCPAHADKFKPGTRYTAKYDGSIKFGGFRPNCTVESVAPLT